MATVSKGVLKARLLEFLRDVEATGEELIITNHGVPVLKVVPLTRRQPAEALFADVRGLLSWKGSLDEPTSTEWADA